MRVLITNDDGIAAHGILTLARRLRDDGHEVTVVAPQDDRSGSGTGLGRLVGGDEVRFARRAPLDDEIPMITLDAPPAMCVVAALDGAVGSRPDLVVSGINHGPNLGFAVLHSGTVGAALTAQLAGVPGLAISVGEPRTGAHGAILDDDAPVWPLAADLAAALVTRVDAWGTRWVPNVNVPSTWDGAEPPVCTRLARLGAIQVSAGDEDRAVIHITSSADLDAAAPATGEWPVDMVLNGAGRATVTPLSGVGTAAVDAAIVEELTTAVRT